MVLALAYRSNVVMFLQVDYQHKSAKNYEFRNREKQTHTVQKMTDLLVKLIFSGGKQTSPSP